MMLACSKDRIVVAEVGKPVPNYTFTHSINTDKNPFSLADLKGKVVILEFWATWCGPCIPAMKKLDKLQAKFGDALEVIAVSREDEKRLQRFIKSTQTSLNIVSDTTHDAYFRYKVIPHAVIIDAKGVVRAITNPKNINEKVLKDLIEKDEIDLELKDDYYVDPTLKVETLKTVAHKDYQLSLQGYDQEKRGGSQRLKDADGNEKGIQFNNSNIPRMFLTLFEVSSINRLVFRDSLSLDDFPYKKEFLYNLRIEASNAYQKQWRQLGIDFLNAQLNINARMSTDRLPCYVLEKIDDRIQESTAETSEFMFRGPIFNAKKIKMGQLTTYIENFTSIPVLDKTGLTGLYDIELNWQSEDPKTLHSELAKYGLQLKRSPDKQLVEVLEIYKKTP